MYDEEQNQGGRTKLAQIPAAPGSATQALAAAAAVENLAVCMPRAPGPGPAVPPAVADLALPAGGASPIPAAAPVMTPISNAPPMTVPTPIPAPVGQSAAQRPPTVTSRDEEESLLAVIRLVDRLAASGVLSAVERALISGAKVAFEQLVQECDKLLKRKLSDLAKAPSAVSPPPRLGPEKKTTGEATGAGGKTKRGASRKAVGKKSSESAKGR